MDVRRRIDFRAIGATTSTSSASATGLAVDDRPRAGRGPADRVAAPSVTSSRSRSPGTTCRRNLARSTPRSATRARGGPVAALEQQQRRHLRQRLDHQHRRHQRRAREMALEELFVDGDVLDRHQPLAPARARRRRRRAARDSGTQRRSRTPGMSRRSPLPGGLAGCSRRFRRRAGLAASRLGE